MRCFTLKTVGITFSRCYSVGMLMLSCLVGNTASGVDLLNENFDDLTLNPVVTFFSEIRNREAWTTTPPTPFSTEVWSIDNSLMPIAAIGDNSIGVTEFEGWMFVDRDWWIQTSGGQGREQFLSASGTIAVADPDEWDDFPNETGTNSPTFYGKFDSTMRISQIPLQGIAPNTANLSFFSSWRPEGFDDRDNTNNQTATLSVTYNTTPTPTTITVFEWDSDEESPNYKPDATNEFVNVPLLNPTGATEAKLEFRLSNAFNDWWWGVDNISMFTGAAPAVDGALRLIINRDTQEVKIVNNTNGVVNLRAYSIESRFGTLDESVATYKADSDPTNWVILDAPNSSELSEGHLNFFAMPNITSNPTLGTINLGNSWRQYFEDIDDISFQYSLEGVDGPLTGIIEFQGNGGESFDSLDLNYDGALDLGDYQAFLDGYGSTNLAGLLPVEKHNLGDLNGDGKFSVQDFLEFKRQFDLKRGPGTLEALIAAANVPEPNSLLLFTCAGFAFVGFARLRTRRLALIGAVASLLLVAGEEQAQAQLPLYLEDFESVPLGASPEEDPSQLNVWNQTGPNGWVVDDSGVPGIGDPANDGVTDWAGWAFVDKDFWVEADDQTRSQFTRGSGTIMVADPDEWEDATVLAAAQTPPYNFYDAKVTTKVINIPNGVPAGKIKLAFDSSWRPEGMDDGDVGELNNQTATIKAIYNVGAPIEVLRFDSDPESETFKPDAQNEGLEIDLQHNGAYTTVKLEFNLGNAWNDWWWAVDNLRVFVPADPSILRIDIGTGVAQIVGGDVINTGINSIDIQSLNGNLNPTGNFGLSYTKPNSIDGPDLDAIVGNNINEHWSLAGANANYFSEFFLDGHSDFTNARTESLGQIFDTTTPIGERDLTFTYTNIFGDEIMGLVEYVGVLANADFDNDGDVDGRDFLKWQRGAGLTGQTNNSNGDANGDGTVNSLDLSVWQSQYGSAPLVAASIAVPEPNTAAMLIVSVVGLALASRRRFELNFGQLTRVSLPAKAAFGFLSAALALTCSVETFAAVIPPPTLDRNYRFGDTDGVVAGSQVTTTRDDAGVGPSSTQQLVPLTGTSPQGVRPTYVTVTGRPDGVGGLGIQINNTSPFVRQYLTTIPQLALNLPIRSPSSTESDFGTGSIDYRFITDRGFQLWTRPSQIPAGANNAHIVMDSNNHGVFIKGGGKFSMRYAGFDYTGVTTAAVNNWYHLMVVRPFGPGSGSILYVNGVAEAADTGLYLGEQDLTAEEVLLPAEIDDSALVIGANTAESSGQIGQNSYYSGIVDDLQMFVMGYNNSADYGEFLFERDNSYAAFFKPAVAGDVTGDGQVTIADVNVFASNWLYEKRLTWLHQGLETDERSLRVGDLSTRALGDFDFSGRIDLGDWEVLNDASPTLAALAMARIQGVPEPAGMTMAVFALSSLIFRRRKEHFRG